MLVAGLLILGTANAWYGDPWYRPVAENEAGQSLIVVRTERGRRIVREAMRAGALDLERRSLATLAASQPNLEKTRGAVFGRCLTSRIAGGSAPRYRGAGLHRVWWRALSPAAKFRSIAGTLKRLLRKGLLRSERNTLLKVRQPLPAFARSARRGWLPLFTLP